LVCLAVAPVLLGFDCEHRWIRWRLRAAAGVERTAALGAAATAGSIRAVRTRCVEKMAT